jgi:isopentenyldiphosphate isomerase
MNDKEKSIQQLIKSFAEKLPKLDDGRIDYTNSDIAPVLTVFITYNNKILILKRSDKVLTFKGKWNTVAGYLDELKSLNEKIHEELREEVGILPDNIKSYHFGESYKFTDSYSNRTWIIYPILIELINEPEIKLDWEHTEYKWIIPSDIVKYDTVPNAAKSLKRAFPKCDLL